MSSIFVGKVEVCNWCHSRTGHDDDLIEFDRRLSAVTEDIPSTFGRQLKRGAGSNGKGLGGLCSCCRYFTSAPTLAPSASPSASPTVSPSARPTDAPVESVVTP